MHKTIHDALSASVHAHFASPEHKLAVMSFIHFSHVTSDGKLAIFDERHDDTLRMIGYAAQCSKARASELHADLLACGALSAFLPRTQTSNGYMRLLDWTKACPPRETLAKAA